MHFRSLALGKGAATALPVWAKFMTKVDRDPAFKNNRNQHFPPLSQSAMDQLNCASYEELKQNLWDKLFGKKKKDNKEDSKSGEKKNKPRKGLWRLFRKKNE